MTWYAWPAIVIALTFIAVLMQPKRRISQFAIAFVLSCMTGTLATLLTLLVWAVTR